MLVLSRAAAGDELEPAEGRQPAADLVGDAVGEVLVGRVAQVFEGQDGEEARSARTGRLDLPVGPEAAEQDDAAENESNPDEDGGTAVGWDGGTAVRRYGGRFAGRFC